jgi:hypothetical protein
MRMLLNSDVPPSPFVGHTLDNVPEKRGYVQSDKITLLHQGVTLLLNHTLRDGSRKVKRQTHENVCKR